MNLKDRIIKKSNLWHVGAILLFIIVASVYFSPTYSGHTIKQGDIVNFVGMSREVGDYRDNGGEQILWTNAMFSGMPTTQISMIYEGTWLAKGITTLVGFGLPRPVLYLFMYFFSFYILAMAMKIKPIMGIVGSLAFGLSSYFIVILEAGHNSKAAAIGLAPLLIAGFIMAYRFKNWILGVALASVFMMIQLSANHIQITYYIGFVLLLMGIAELVRHIKENQLPKFFKVTGFLLVGYVFALLVNYGNLFGTIEYAKQTIRGGTELTISPDGSTNEGIITTGLDREYITSWSYGLEETFSLFVPNFKGGETQAIGQNEANKDVLKNVDPRFKQNISQSNQYWGDQPFTSGPVYIGIIVMFLGFLGLVYSKEKLKWALLSATLLAITLSWGKNYVSAFVLFPILLYNVNIFLEGKKQQIFTAIITVLLLLAITSGDMFISSSLTDFFLDYVPGYNKLRAVTIILIVAELCIPLLGILFLNYIVKSRGEILKNMNGFYIISGIFGVFLLLLLGAPDLFNTFLSAQESGMIEAVTDPNKQMQYIEMYDSLEEARIDIFKRDVLRSLGFFVIGAGLIFAYLRFGFSKIALGAGLAIFILIDLLVIDQRYLNTDGKGKKYDQWVENYEMVYPFAAGDGEKQILAMETQKNPLLAQKIDSALNILNAEFKGNKDISGREKQMRIDFLTYRVLNRNSNFRVFEVGNPFNSSYTSYFNKSIGGYHGAKLGRYQELIEFHLSKQNPAVIDMLNAQYFLQRTQTGSQLVRINENAMGNAWFAKSVEIVENSDKEILALNSYDATKMVNKGLGQVFVDGQPIQTADITGGEKITIQLDGMPEPIPVDNIPYQALADQPLALIVDSAGLNWVNNMAPDSMFQKIFSITAGGRGGWDPSETTFIDQRYSSNISSANYSGAGSIEMTSYHPDRMVYTSSSSEKQLAVFSEMYYEGGWTAYVDDQEVPISRVNYVLRAIEVPAGEHTIRFDFALASYEKATTMAMVGTIAILLLLITGIYIETKREDEEGVIDGKKNESKA